MPAKRIEKQPVQAMLTVDAMRTALPKIERRIKDLDEFDVNSINDRNDPRIGALRNQLDTFLIGVFGAGTVEYERYHWQFSYLDTASVNLMYETPLREVREGLAHGIATARAQLEAIKSGFLEEIEDAQQFSAPVTPPPTARAGKDVFIVHGHDELLKTDVARTVEKLQLNAIILHEKANEGKTLIEKFEAHSDVGFAIVLLTPDDMGGPVGKTEQQPRARQNVILEHGYFLGKLGRKNVCAIYSEGVELPSDLSGLLYVKYDKEGMWKYSVGREMQAAGISVNLNLL